MTYTINDPSSTHSIIGPSRCSPYIRTYVLEDLEERSTPIQEQLFVGPNGRRSFCILRFQYSHRLDWPNYIPMGIDQYVALCYVCHLVESNAVTMADALLSRFSLSTPDHTPTYKLYLVQKHIQRIAVCCNSQVLPTYSTGEDWSSARPPPS